MEGFTTVSGSTYEVDLQAQAIRRVGNAAGRPPTPRQGRDGQWRTYYQLALVQSPGESVSITIVWDPSGALTITSCLATISPQLSRLLQTPHHPPRS